MSKGGTLLSGSLLIAGTAIGGGMLAMPILTSPAGFIPSMIVYVVCWLFMASTGLLFLEICLSMKKEANIVSMAEETFGFFGKAYAWALYIFLFSCLTIAYIVGCGNLLTEFSQGTISDWQGPLLFVLLFAPLVFLGTRFASRLNIIFMTCLTALYFAFVFIGIGHVDTDFLAYRDWSKMTFALPIAFTAFAYQGIIPTLAHYLNYDAKKTRQCILIGSLITLVTYVIWEWLILGIVPVEGPGGLKEAISKGSNAIHPLKNFLQNPAIYAIGQYFAFFALLTSFLGVSLGLLDFLSDGLKIRKDFKGKLLLCSLIYIPTLLISISHPHIFLVSLDYAGGFGCALLLGLLPILMVWVRRYYFKMQAPTQLPYGKIFLCLLLIFVVFEVGTEIQHIWKKH
jgi:tyrosine-specific transport protein